MLNYEPKLKDPDEVEKLMKDCNIEIFAFCKTCGESWCTMSESEIIKECGKCKDKGYIVNVLRISDTVECITSLHKRIEDLENGISD